MRKNSKINMKKYVVGIALGFVGFISIMYSGSLIAENYLQASVFGSIQNSLQRFFRVGNSEVNNAVFQPPTMAAVLNEEVCSAPDFSTYTVADMAGFNPPLPWQPGDEGANPFYQNYPGMFQCKERGIAFCEYYNSLYPGKCKLLGFNAHIIVIIEYEEDGEPVKCVVEPLTGNFLCKYVEDWPENWEDWIYHDWCKKFYPGANCNIYKPIIVDPNNLPICSEVDGTACTPPDNQPGAEPYWQFTSGVCTYEPPASKPGTMICNCDYVQQSPTDPFEPINCKWDTLYQDPYDGLPTNPAKQNPNNKVNSNKNITPAVTKPASQNVE